MGGVTTIPIKQVNTPTINLDNKVPKVYTSTTGVQSGGQSAKTGATFGDVFNKVLDTVGKYLDYQSSQNQVPTNSYIPDPQPTVTAASGIGGINPLVIGAVGVGAYLLLKD